MLESDVLIQNIARIGESEPERVFAKVLFPQNQSATITYQNLFTNAAKYVTLYTENNVRKGRIVVIILNHGLELLYSFVGALFHGAIPSIFAHPSIKIPAQEYTGTLLRLLDVCDTRFLLTNKEISAQLSHEKIVQDNVRLLLADDYVHCPASSDRPSYEATEIVLLQHSSGTTGLKKGVALSNRSVVNQLRNYASALLLKDDDKIASWLPLYHDMGLIAGFILPLACRVPLVLMSAFDWISNPIILPRAIHEDRCTLCWMPNFAYNFLATRINDDQTKGLDLSSMRAFINCAEPISARSHQLFYQRFRQHGLREEALCTCYAMAENTFAVTQGGLLEAVKVEALDAKALRNQQKAILTMANDTASQTVVSSGEPIRNNEIRIIDDNGRELPERSIGEIAIRSDSMLSEYYRRPDLTQQAIKAGWYFTGDLGYFAKRNLFVVGRKKDMIIVAGKNLYPQDIEEIVSSIDGIHPGRVAAFGIYDEQIGTEEVIVLAESTVDDRAKQLPIKLAIAKAVREQLECIVNDIVLLPPMWLLKSSSGKISRPGNRERYLRELRRHDGLAQKTET
jgi:fatty-acyl-CoA synthase